jgi:hypothetical protein
VRRVSANEILCSLTAIEKIVRELREDVLALEARQVVTEERPDYVLKQMLEVRLDNDEIISTRPLTLLERNARLFEEDV